VTNTELLEQVIAESGIKKGAIAKKIGISAYSLAKKINRVTEFKASEIDAMCCVLHITDRRLKEQIFFCKK